MSSNEYMNTYMKQRYKDRRQIASEYLGGFCVDCKTKNNLEFHHKDSTTKLFTIAKGSSRSDVVFWAEVEKCELLCSNCHRARHNVLNPCGTVQKYWQGCDCADCKTANANHNTNYRRSRST